MKNTTNTPESALVLFSGGQDSTTCLAWALARYAHVETIGFDYGQRHAIELAVRPTVLQKMRALKPEWNERLGDDHMIDLSLIAKISDTALTQDVEIAMQENGLPNTFVPGRNLLFMTVAATVAYRRGLTVLVGGMCETDFSGYPDCRDDTMKALQVTLNLGMATRLKVETPLMWIDKAQTWTLAENLGGRPFIDLIRQETHTCYLGERGALHDWGYGCGTCPACALRARGYGNFVTGKSA
ncbi:7-cyano-7-deazaguanine synthase QueC [Oxalicibacterium solurbis]|uniref:7-cyano-7-deazaguanine synthase n=1 Tax=Oxalicibacterium solurbis TaxID=69280 RepID=A0A8J3B2W0_9BURK|nr:7-cyano-7-deazaguanine synthase QueC [Oxalicibacterium solurbis]GGI53789.1 7-cyano-7-deazaguanine synthase [Oxalicibacterium solurbis]